MNQQTSSTGRRDMTERMWEGITAAEVKAMLAHQRAAKQATQPTLSHDRERCQAWPCAACVERHG